MTPRPIDVPLDHGLLSRAVGQGAGGQGVVHFLADGRTAFKLYREPAKVDFNRLRRLVRLGQLLPAASSVSLTRLAAWPTQVLVENGVPVGVSMPLVAERFYMQIVDPQGRRVRRLQELQHLNKDGFLSARGQYAPTSSERLEVVGRLASTMSLLHELGVVMGDISMRNLLWTMTPSPDLFVIDADSFVPQWGDPPQDPQPETPGWKAPPGLKPPSVASDRYKLALVAHRTLSLRNEVPLDPGTVDFPSDPSVAAGVRELVRRAQMLDPAPPEDWAAVCGVPASGVRAVARRESWVDLALMNAQWESAIELGSRFDPHNPRLDAARQHLAIETGGVVPVG